jgi:Holliday junction resolvasome RuvABC endonuclease subunit
MLTRFRPDVLVVEDIHERETNRTIRLKRICKAIKPAAADLSIDIAVVSRKNVRAAFAFFGATNKLEIASVIAEKIEAFAPRMPKARRSWEGQDPRMALFDAASRGLTYYYRLEEVAK